MCTVPDSMWPRKWLGLLSVLGIVAFGTNALSKDWNGIIPCVSVRSDVERLVGKDAVSINPGIYSYKKSRVHVRYNQKDRNSPEKDIVEKIEVYLDEELIFAKYVRKIPDFRKKFVETALDDSITHVHGRAVYRNWADGFEIWVQIDDDDTEIISSFGYFDPAWDCAKRLPVQESK